MLAELISKYLQELQITGKSPGTIESYGLHLAKFARFCEENGCDYRHVNGKGSKAFRNRLVSQGLKPASGNVAISATKSFYDFLVEKDHVKGNPMMTKRLRIAEEQSLPAFLTEEERTVLAHIATLPSHLSLAFRTMLATGLRVSEAANLDPEDVLLQQGAVFLMVRHGKGQQRAYSASH